MPIKRKAEDGGEEFLPSPGQSKGPYSHADPRGSGGRIQEPRQEDEVPGAPPPPVPLFRWEQVEGLQDEQQDHQVGPQAQGILQYGNGTDEGEAPRQVPLVVGLDVREARLFDLKAVSEGLQKIHAEELCLDASESGNRGPDQSRNGEELLQVLFSERDIPDQEVVDKEDKLLLDAPHPHHPFPSSHGLPEVAEPEEEVRGDQHVQEGCGVEDPPDPSDFPPEQGQDHQDLCPSRQHEHHHKAHDLEAEESGCARTDRRAERRG